MKNGANTSHQWHQSHQVIAEFRIHGTLCRVVPIERVNETLTSGMEAEAQVIGSCQVDGQVYLIVFSCSAKQELNNESIADTSAVEVLTPRELQVALMICEGHGNKQIAYQLKLSEWTVSSYLRRIFAKLRVRTRAAMVARLMTSVKPHRDLAG